MAPTDSGGDDNPEPDDLAATWFSEETATFGDRLAGAREAAGMSQRALAERIGIKTGTLRKWEDDLAEPRANRLNMMAGILGVSLSWLLTGRGEGIDTPPEETVEAAEVMALLDEVRVVRGQMEQGLARLATLEKRLRRAARDAA